MRATFEFADAGLAEFLAQHVVVDSDELAHGHGWVQAGAGLILCPLAVWQKKPRPVRAGVRLAGDQRIKD
jgi:hypothetical protein